MLGRYVRVKVTSPIHSENSQQGFTYGLNYGEINFVTARKRETLKAFIMGIDHPVKTFDGRVIATVEKDGERYVKHFNAWQHMVIMLYAVIKRFDSLREITDSMFPEARKLSHLGINMMPRRSTLSDANARRSESIFEATYRDLYATYKDELSSDSRKRKTPQWMNRLQIIDSTTITLFSNLLFKGIGRNPKSGKKKGGIKVHANIHANEGVPSDIKFTSAATNDSFMLKPANYAAGDILAFDRAYIDYAKFEELTRNGVVYVTKMKKNLVYTIGDDTMYMMPEGKCHTAYST